MELSRRYLQMTFVSLWKKFIIFIIAIRTFIVRCMFILYASIGIWNVVIEKTSIYWLLLITIVPLFVETFIGIHQIKMNDNAKMASSKWFSPVVALFLLSACPSIWILELTICAQVTVVANKTAAIPFGSQALKEIPLNRTQQTILSQREKWNTTISPILTRPELRKTTMIFINQTKEFDKNESIITGINVVESLNGSMSNVTDFKNPENETSIVNNVTMNLMSIIPTNSTTTTNMRSGAQNPNITANETIKTSYLIVNENKSQIQLYSMTEFQGAQVIKDIETMWSKYDIQSRVTILEQILLLNLILCRWILPRGGITRDQLSQLLLVNIGMSADILELFEAMKEPFVRHNFILNAIILILWQMSLIQFSLTKTATKARKIRMGFSEDYGSNSKSESKLQLTNCICCQTELWAIATSLLLQDIPFFCLRMTLIFHFKILSYSNIFFTSKNTLVILLQLFRSYVILCEAGNKDKELSSAISKQSLGSTGAARWTQVPARPCLDATATEKGRPLISDRYDLKKNGADHKHISETLPRASPELSITSIGNNSRSNSQMSNIV